MSARLPGSFSPARLEALADGVFAIAITLLVLEIRLPETTEGAPGGLGHALRAVWPSYLGYALSFIMIGIMWVNHHSIFRLLERVDHTFTVLNLLLLLVIAFVPFPTRVLAEHLRDPRSQVAAAAFYSGTYTLIGIVFNLVWRYAAGGRRLLHTTVSDETTKAITRRYMAGPTMYALATGLAFVSVALSLGVVIALAVLFLLPYRPPSAG